MAYYNYIGVRVRKLTYKKERAALRRFLNAALKFMNRSIMGK